MIFVIAIGILGTMLYMNEEVYQRVYNEGDSIASGYLNFTVTDSYISNLTHGGNVLNKDKYYVILLLEINNRYREDHEFNYINLELTVNNKYILPNLSLGNYFTDFGTPYNGTYIKGNTNSEYILVYEIDKNLINQDFLLTVYSHYDASAGGIGSVNNRISLNPTIISDEITTNTVNLGTNINLSNTTLGNTIFTITDYEFTNRYEYSYEYCINANNCIPSTDSISINYANDGSRRTLLVLGYELNLDTEVPYMNTVKTYRSFFENFVKIEYEINGQTYTTTATLANPSTYNEKAVLNVPREVGTASRVDIILTVRNISYRIRLVVQSLFLWEMI